MPNGLHDVLTALDRPRLTLVEGLPRLPAKPGVYAIHGMPQVWDALGLRGGSDGRPLYVGKSESSLQSRDVKTHFAEGRTGWSTVRRSLAALLHDELGLRAIPRNPDNPSRCANFGLSPEHDAKLTAWMRRQLELSVWERYIPVDLGDLETAVLGVLRPPLNIKKVTTPWKAQVSDARRIMADEARMWARTRGLDCPD